MTGESPEEVSRVHAEHCFVGVVLPGLAVVGLLDNDIRESRVIEEPGMSQLQ